VLSSRGLCDELITRPEESYPLWCVVVRDLETSRIWGGHDPCRVAAPQKKKSDVALCIREKYFCSKSCYTLQSSDTTARRSQYDF